MTFCPLLIDTKAFPLFKLPYLHRSRRREIYRMPLLIVHQSPPAEFGRIRVAVSDSDLVYNETYYGGGQNLCRYLGLDLFYHSVLIGYFDI